MPNPIIQLAAVAVDEHLEVLEGFEATLSTTAVGSPETMSRSAAA